jgi:hypothetical protein
MRTSNIKILNEIDILEDKTGLESKDLELVKRIDKLESKTLIFFIVSNKVHNMFFKEREAAMNFINKQPSSSGFNLIATTFADS